MGRDQYLPDDRTRAKVSLADQFDSPFTHRTKLSPILYAIWQRILNARVDFSVQDRDTSRQPLRGSCPSRLKRPDNRTFFQVWIETELVQTRDSGTCRGVDAVIGLQRRGHGWLAHLAQPGG